MKPFEGFYGISSNSHYSEEGIKMKRLYYLTENADAAELASDSLHNNGITDWNFHVLGKDKANVIKHHLHSTTPLHELDIIRSGERGVLLGFLSGIVVAVVVATFASTGETFSILLQSLTIIALFSLFGAWLGGLVGVSTENYKIRRFHDDIEAGSLLLMIDVSAAEQASVVEMLKRIPQIRPAGEDSTVINPFASVAIS